MGVAWDDVVLVITKSEAILILTCIEELVRKHMYGEAQMLRLHEKIRNQVYPDERK